MGEINWPKRLGDREWKLSRDESDARMRADIARFDAERAKSDAKWAQELKDKDAHYKELQELVDSSPGKAE